ncbi:hypothetical protein ATE67_03370 [Sphingopyxis sp. H050]|nr:hypothetical protein ATE67_03370 [Sphingopyxis sp. H050]KTE32413.1 hypothetical protein ATE62_18165 [Sphingopyxis sp. HIX]KTE83196.1 hypothetical protein ATE72_15350 [Sphingopyxis sp. HXXIV]
MTVMFRHAARRAGAALQRAARACLASLRFFSAAPGTADLRSRYRAAVDALPVDQLAVFMMHRVDDLAISEIATRLGMTSAEIEHNLANALHAIAIALEGD